MSRKKQADKPPSKQPAPNVEKNFDSINKIRALKKKFHGQVVYGEYHKCSLIGLNKKIPRISARDSLSILRFANYLSRTIKLTVRLPTLTGLDRSTSLAFLAGSLAKPSLSFSEVLSKTCILALPLKPGISSFNS